MTFAQSRAGCVHVCACGVQTEEQPDGGYGQNVVTVMRVKGHVLLLPLLMITADSTSVPPCYSKGAKKSAPNIKLLKSKKSIDCG